MIELKKKANVATETAGFKTLRVFLAEVGKTASCALLVKKQEQLEAVVAEIKTAGVGDRISSFPLKKGVLVTSAVKEVVAKLPGIGASAGVDVLPRVDLSNCEAILGKPAPGWKNPAIEGGTCFLPGFGDNEGEEALLFENLAEKKISAELLLDAGFRSSFRTIRIMCGLDGDGRAIPLSYRISRYEWKDGKLTLKSSEEFGHDHPLGAKMAASEYLACQGTKEDALSEFVEGSKEYEAEAGYLDKRIAVFKGSIFRLTGLALAKTAQTFPKPRKPRRGYQDKPIGTSLAEALEASMK